MKKVFYCFLFVNSLTIWAVNQHGYEKQTRNVFDKYYQDHDPFAYKSSLQKAAQEYPSMGPISRMILALSFVPESIVGATMYHVSCPHTLTMNRLLKAKTLEDFQDILEEEHKFVSIILKLRAFDEEAYLKPAYIAKHLFDRLKILAHNGSLIHSDGDHDKQVTSQQFFLMLAFDDLAQFTKIISRIQTSTPPTGMRYIQREAMKITEQFETHDVALAYRLIEQSKAEDHS